MNQFQLYFTLGYQHILDLNGFDHILFVLALCAIYKPADWKKIIVLITAFTLGHSITLALATLNLVTFNSDVIEFLIPLTILVTCIFNIARPEPLYKNIQLNYLFGLFFGLIHGLGFSNYLRSLLGQEQSIVQPLLAFNVGLEAGQLLIVAVYLGFSALLLKVFPNKKRDITLITSAIVAGMSFMLLIDATFW
jgi:hypothetical protein